MLPVSNTKEQKALSLQEYKCPSTYDTTSQYSIVLTSQDILLEHAWRRRALARFLSGSCSRPEFEVF